MLTPFRTKHLLHFLYDWTPNYPLDLALHTYFKENRSLGSTDRKEIREAVFFLIRNLRAIDPDDDLSWEERVEKMDGFELDRRLPPEVQTSFPDFLYQEMVSTWGGEMAFQIAKASNTQAPVTVRANTAKISRDALLRELKKEYKVKPTLKSPHGITFLEPVRFDTISLFKKGFFEVQDEGSQLIAEMVQVKPKDLFLDFCSGSGGKSLAIAPKMQGKGSLFLHDIRKSALQEARKRLKKAGVQNGQFLPADHPAFKQIKGKCDWILVDVPCSGTGTLRRSPEMKWRLTPASIPELILLQREIFDHAMQYLKPGGRLTYSTCSILAKENQQQIDYFLSQYPLKLEGDILSTFPKIEEMDGFFGATLRLNGDGF